MSEMVERVEQRPRKAENKAPKVTGVDWAWER